MPPRADAYKRCSASYMMDTRNLSAMAQFHVQFYHFINVYFLVSFFLECELVLTVNN